MFRTVLTDYFRRMKLSHDPNNTKWTNDTSSFGLKIMTSQGWEPGQYLGAKDASHAEFHTAANASHIRVAIKDDTLGIGAKIGSGVGHGECTGLDAFKDLLGRLNGKEEDEIAKERKSREDLKRAIYSERKWGSQRFVSGGFLIGDKIQVLIDNEAERIRKLALGNSGASTSDSSSEEESEEEKAAPVDQSKKSKKRKADALVESEPRVVAVKVKKSKKSRKDKETEVADDNVPSEDEKASKKSKKSKNDRKSKPEVDEELSDFKQRKTEKKERKERRAKERMATSGVEESKEERKARRKAKRDKKAAEDDTDSSQTTTKESTPVVAAPNTQSRQMMQGRHAVRSRYIAQKRLASMDVASLNQVRSPPNRVLKC